MMIRFLLLVAALAMQNVLAESLHDLENHGTLLRLQGDFDRAEVIEKELIDKFAEPAGHVFALNTIVTHLTWDETQTVYDDALNYHARQTLEWCEDAGNQKKDSTKANYYCGQANFALAYYHGLKGSYYQAGKRGTACIDYLEAVLEEDPTLVDAKMHLGISYFVADNLPPFIKMFS
ncbi:MAG: hypothetical protein MI725_00040, partial [Pirellulales bacterium]|nr:hypothetical protein [Pirellulales bacterium]